MKIIYTLHAQERIRTRGINKEKIKKTINNPEITLPTRDPRRSRVKRKFDNEYIDVIFEKRNDQTIIITVF